MTKPSLIVIAVVDRRSHRSPAPPGPAKKTSGRATIKGVDYYYEVRGQGEPLLLLHGGLGNSDMFEPLLPLLRRADR